MFQIKALHNVRAKHVDLTVLPNAPKDCKYLRQDCDREILIGLILTMTFTCFEINFVFRNF